MEVMQQIEKGGAVHGISLPALLQLMESEKKTCILRIDVEKDLRGYLYVQDGALIAAKIGEEKAEAAALRILSAQKPSIEIGYHPFHRKQEITIPLSGLLSEHRRRSRRKGLQGAEQRKAERVDCFLTVDYEHKDWATRSHMLDISTTGAYLETDYPVSLGDTIMVTIMVPSINRRCVIQSTVVRRDEYGIGIRFNGMDRSDVRLLEYLMEAECAL